MKRYLLSLFCVALASTAWAQGQGAVMNPFANNHVTQTTAIMPAAVVSTAVPVATGSCPSGGCAQNCCPQTKTVCVSQPATVVRTKVLFSSSCQTVCSKGICDLFKKASDCDACQADGTCGHPYVKRDLYKRVEKTECPSFKCVPAQVPVCAPAPAPCAASCVTKCDNGTCSATVVAVNGTPVSQVPVTASPAMPTTAQLAITTSPGVVVATPVSMRPTIGFASAP